jgi:hypothetical protein
MVGRALGSPDARAGGRQARLSPPLAKSPALVPVAAAADAEPELERSSPGVAAPPGRGAPAAATPGGGAVGERKMAL